MLRCLMLNVKVKNEAECKPERDLYDECKNKKKKNEGVSTRSETCKCNESDGR